MYLLEFYLCSVESAYHFERKNGLFHGAIRSWLRTFDIEDKPRSQEMKKQEKNLGNDSRKEVEVLKWKVRQLEYELKNSNMARDVYNYLIELAEEKYAIKIRKKLRCRVVEKLSHSGLGYSVKRLCKLPGISP